MGTPLALSNGTILQRSGGGSPLSRSPQATRQWQLVNSFKGAVGLENTNLLLRFAEPFQDIVDGSTVLYNPMELEDQGHIGRGGEIVSMPVDAAIDAVRCYANLTIPSSGMWEQPAAYNGRVIVFKVASGTIGDGNTLGFQNFGSSTTAVIDSTGAGYRIELTIDDVANWPTQSLIFRINFSGTADQQSRLDQLALLSNVKLAAFFKDQEALYDDIPNNLWKAWDIEWRTKKDHWDILRFMDFTGYHIFTPTHCKDFSQPADPCWGNVGGTSYSVTTLNGPGHSRRQGYPIEALLNLCENGSPSGNPWTAWFNLPAFSNSPVRKNMTSYQLGSATYREDGVVQTYNQSDSVFWFDPAWVDLSSLVLTAGPTHGEFKILDTTTGRVVYNPDSGGDPWTTTSPEGQEELTFTFNRIDYDASNNPSTGAQVSFTVPIRVLWDGGRSVHYCRIKSSEMWPLNQTYFEDANRWQSQARALVDAIVASGYSTQRPLYLEVGNELWNSGVFEVDRLMTTALTAIYDSAWSAWQTANSKDGVSKNQGGGGLISAYYRYYIDQELASRGLSYNIKFTSSVQTAIPARSKAVTQAFLFALDDIFGYTAQQQTDAMANFFCCGTSYIEGPLKDVGDSITNLTGTAHTDEVLDRFDGTKAGYNADSTTLAADMVTWMTKAEASSGTYNNAAVVALHASHIANCEAEGGNWLGEYEGGDHATEAHIPADIRDSIHSTRGTVTNSAGKTFKEWYEQDFMTGPDRATIAADLYAKMIAQKSDTAIAQYGDDTRRRISQPWAQGLPTLDPKYPDIQKIIDDYGRL